MKKKLFILTVIITATAVFGAAASCNLCGVNVETSPTAPDTVQQSPAEEVGVEFAGGAGESNQSETGDSVENEAVNEQEINAGNGMPAMAEIVPIFAIASEAGDRLITYYFNTVEETLKNINSATHKDGHAYNIEYAGKQQKNDNDSGRVISENFDNMEGYVYRVTGNDLLTANKSYFLYNSHAIEETGILSPVNNGVEELDEETLQRAEDIKGRQIQKGWLISEYNDGTKLSVIVFQPDGQDMLMSIVLDFGGNLILNDYPATMKGYSAWRVDDGGEINPELFSSIVAIKTSEGLCAAVGWAGAEGEKILFLAEDAGSLIELPLDIYRYWLTS